MPRRRAKIIDKDRGWRRIKAELARAKAKPHVQVGIFGAQAAADHGGKPNIEIAAVHEFGTEHVPERTFLRGTVDAKHRDIRSMAKRLAAAVVAGSINHARALNLLGQFARGLMQKRISSGIPPPLKPATVARKGSAVPLIDTGQLRASLDWKVRARGAQ